MTCDITAPDLENNCSSQLENFKVHYILKVNISTSKPPFPSLNILELSPVDLNRFRTLQKTDKQLQAAFKMSKKRGGNLDEDGED
jgi:hypothetical protein